MKATTRWRAALGLATALALSACATTTSTWIASGALPLCGDGQAPLRAEGVDTALFVRIEEPTPRLAVTMPLPIRWWGTREADFRVRAVDVAHGRVRLDARIRRTTGGAFQLRPAAWSEEELLRAFEAVLSQPGG